MKGEAVQVTNNDESKLVWKLERDGNGSFLALQLPIVTVTCEPSKERLSSPRVEFNLLRQRSFYIRIVFKRKIRGDRGGQCAHCRKKSTDG